MLRRMEILIVRADLHDPAHGKAILDVLDSYASDPMGGSTPLSADVRERLLPALRQHPTTHVWLALADGAAVGIAVCFMGFSTFRAQPLLNLHDLAVLPSWRGKGVGRKLLAAVEVGARVLGCCKLTLEVLDTNQRARGLYASFGFDDFVLGDGSGTRFLAKNL